jgi:transketolase
MYASANKVDNIISTVDYNGRQIDGDVDKVLSLGNLKAKFEAFGWTVLENTKGNDLNAVFASFTDAKKHCGKGKPVMILMKTEMGQGVDYMMGTHKWHGSEPNDEQLQKALDQLPVTLGDY